MKWYGMGSSVKLEQLMGDLRRRSRLFFEGVVSGVGCRGQHAPERSLIGGRKEGGRSLAAPPSSTWERTLFGKVLPTASDNPFLDLDECPGTFDELAQIRSWIGPTIFLSLVELRESFLKEG